MRFPRASTQTNSNCINRRQTRPTKTTKVVEPLTSLTASCKTESRVKWPTDAIADRKIKSLYYKAKNQGELQISLAKAQVLAAHKTEQMQARETWDLHLEL